MAEKLEVIIGAKDQFSSTFEKLKGAIVGIAAAYASWQGIKAVAQTFKAVADEADRFSKLSDRLGYTAETLSKLSYAAQLSDVEFSSLSQALQYAQRSTAEAAQGNETLARTINRIGLSLNQLKSQSPDQMFMSYAAAIGAIKNPAERTAAAMELFGRGGGEMLQMLAGGAEGLKAMTREAERFGVVISSQAAANGAEFNDSLTRINAALIGVRNSLTAELLPYFTSVFNRIAYFIADNRSAIVSWAKAVADAFAAAAKAGLYAAAGITDAWSGLQLIFHGLIYSIADLALSMKNFAADSARFATGAMEWVNELMAASEFHGFLDKPIIAMKRFTGEIQLQSAELLKFQAGVLERMNAIAKDGLNIDKVSAFIAEIKSGLAELQKEGSGKLRAPAMSEVKIELTEKLKTELEALSRLWQEYYSTESQRADIWYAEQQKKFAGHKEALAMIEQVYLAKKYEAVAAEIKADQEKYEAIKANQDSLFQLFESEVLKEEERLKLWYEQQVAMAEGHEEQLALIRELYAERAKKLEADKLQEQLGIYSDFLGGMAAISSAMGKKAFMLEKALNIGRAIMDTYAGAARAMKDHPYPYNMVAAAAVIAFGLAQVAKIAQQKPPEARRGIDYVQADEVYKLHRGERVVPAETNKDLKAFLSASGEGGAGAVSIGSIEISFPNIRSADDLRSLTDREWQDILEERMIPNMRRLAAAGVTL